MRRCVWSRNLKNEEALARVGPQRHKGGGDWLTMCGKLIISVLRIISNAQVHFMKNKRISTVKADGTYCNQRTSVYARW